MDAPYYGMIEEVWVMLIDDDKEFVTKMTDMLKSHNYKVIAIDTTSTTMPMLFEGKQKIDVMIINVNLSNLLFVDLLAQAEALNIISLVVCDEFDELVAKKTLGDGAYLYLKKPFDKEIVRYLWQFVLSEKIRKEKVREGLRKHKDHMKVDDVGNNKIVIENKESEEKNMSCTKEQSNNIHEARNGVELSEIDMLQRKRGTKGKKKNNEGERQNNAIDKVVKRKEYREWTEDLHVRFMQAVHQLGEGRCFPKEIVEVMSLPGLTRMQVASHLQKCRRNNWRSPEERKYIRHLSIKRSKNVPHETKSSFRKFGAMPYLQANVPNQQWNADQIQRDTKFSFPTHNTKNTFAQGETSIQQQLYCPQFQQHGPLFVMLGSQGLQDSIIGNTNFWPAMTLNNEDNHTDTTLISMWLREQHVQNLGPPSANLPNEQGNEFDQVYSDDQNLGPPSANLPNQQDNEFDQVYSDDQNLGPPSVNLPNEQDSEFDQVYSDDH